MLRVAQVSVDDDVELVDAECVEWSEERNQSLWLRRLSTHETEVTDLRDICSHLAVECGEVSVERDVTRNIVCYGSVLDIESVIDDHLRGFVSLDFIVEPCFLEGHGRETIFVCPVVDLPVGWWVCRSWSWTLCYDNNRVRWNNVCRSYSRNNSAMWERSATAATKGRSRATHDRLTVTSASCNAI